MKLSVIFIVCLIMLTSLFDTVNQLLLKSSINSLNLNINSVKKIFTFIIKLLSIRRVWCGFIFCCLSLFIWLFALSKADLNFAFSADSMHYIFIALASRLFLREQVGFKRWAGTIFIILGIIMVTWSNR